MFIGGGLGRAGFSIHLWSHLGKEGLKVHLPGVTGWQNGERCRRRTRGMVDKINGLNGRQEDEREEAIGRENNLIITITRNKSRTVSKAEGRRREMGMLSSLSASKWTVPGASSRKFALNEKQ
jgi:hypothetical protein